ncbi:MAG: hypothetical protein R3B95_16595 [Nitrospirales bacterium]|nr:hypothetical protein [Nitrospirales bacterium]
MANRHGLKLAQHALIGSGLHCSHSRRSTNCHVTAAMRGGAWSADCEPGRLLGTITPATLDSAALHDGWWMGAPHPPSTGAIATYRCVQF